MKAVCGIEEWRQGSETTAKNSREKARGATPKAFKTCAFCDFSRLFRRLPSVIPGQAQSYWVKVRQTDAAGQAAGQIVCKSITMNRLQDKQLSGESNSVKLNQTGFEGGKRKKSPAFLCDFVPLRLCGKNSLRD